MKIVNYIAACFLFSFLSVYISALHAQNNDAAAYTVTGTVRNAANKQVLPGISITLPGITSSMTDDNGSFSIKLPSTNVILHVSGPGYTGKDISVRGRDVINIELYEEGFKSVFDDVYTPAGEQSATTGTNSWSPVKANTILSTKTTADAMLQGKVAGLDVVYRSGAPANGANMYLRGLSTMNAGSQPLYIVDGIPYEDAIYSASLVGNYYSNPLASIDIKDIETITVMKDGTSLYGVKGANGVVLIRTLRAKELETKINFHMHTGVNFESSRIPLLNAGSHKLLVTEQLQSSGLNSSQIQALPYINSEIPVLEKWGYEGNVDYYRYNHNTNWQNEIYSPSFNQNYYLNVFGGDEVALYALSVAFLNQEGVVAGTNFQRFNTRFNSEINLTKKLKLRANMSFVYSSRFLVDEGPYKNTNPIYAALVKSPFTAINVYNEEGNLSPVVEDYDVFGNSNPYALVNNSSRGNTQYRFVGNLEGEYHITDRFKMNALVGVNFNKERERIFYPILGVAFDTLSLGVVRNSMQHRVDRLFSLYTEASAQYNASFGTDHKLFARGGVRYQMNQSEDDWGIGYNSGSDNFKSIGYGDALLSEVGGSIGNWNWLSFYGAVDYGFLNKYFLNYTMAADASTRFGRDASSFVIYPSLSAAWLLTGEEFLKNTDLFNLLKLRASYGISGNDNIGNYNGIQYYVPQNLLGTYGLVRGNLVDLQLKPEKSTLLNVGLDASFLNERVNVSLEWYTKTVEDMITITPADQISGFNYYITNGGAMKNTGIDLTVNTRIINGSSFKWDLGLTVGTYKNEVTRLSGNEYITSICDGEVLTRVGQPLGVFYGYQTDGVYSTQEAAEADGFVIVDGANVLPFAAGDVRFVNAYDADNIIDEKDKVIIGDPNPDFFGSISNDLKYKNWTLSMLMTYSVGNDVYNYTRSQLENLSGYDNQTTAVLKRWRAEGDITSIPRAVYGDPMGNSRFSDRWIEDGSYLKLKQITLSYEFPINTKIIRRCTVFGTAENLLTLTAYKGLDPEFALGQSTLYRGIDAFLSAHPRIFSAGFKLDL